MSWDLLITPLTKSPALFHLLFSLPTFSLIDEEEIIYNRFPSCGSFSFFFFFLSPLKSCFQTFAFSNGPSLSIASLPCGKLCKWCSRDLQLCGQNGFLFAVGFDDISPCLGGPALFSISYACWD